MADPLVRDALRLIQDIVTAAKGSPLHREDISRVEAVLERLATPDHARVAETGYSRREATILFADLRGFSSIAATYPADVVLARRARIHIASDRTAAQIRLYVQMCLQGERPEARSG